MNNHSAQNLKIIDLNKLNRKILYKTKMETSVNNTKNSKIKLDFKTVNMQQEEEKLQLQKFG